MYWTGQDNAGRGVILKAKMDGRGEYETVVGPNVNLTNPRKLALEPRDGTQLYYADGKQGKGQKILVADTRSKDSIRVFKTIDQCQRRQDQVKCEDYEPRLMRGIGVVGDRVYYSHDPDKFIRSCNKLNGTDCRVDRPTVSDAFEMTDLGFYSSDTQPMNRKNDCEGNGGCSHFCVLSGSSYACVCPFGYTNSDSDPKKCKIVWNRW